jgi:hypothetical protein
MDSFQDGGQQNMGSEQGEYFNPMEGPNMNVEMNNFPPSSREQMMGMEKSFFSIILITHPSRARN